MVAFVTLRHFGQDDGAPKRWRSSLILGALLLGLLGIGAAALGADQLIDRFKSGAISTDVRFRVWLDSWRVLQAHPFGIGRGAFDRVYPIYRTIKAPFSLRFAFVENEPLQLLIDCGWLLCGLHLCRLRIGGLGSLPKCAPRQDRGCAGRRPVRRLDPQSSSTSASRSPGFCSPSSRSSPPRWAAERPTSCSGSESGAAGRLSGWRAPAASSGSLRSCARARTILTLNSEERVPWPKTSRSSFGRAPRIRSTTSTCWHTRGLEPLRGPAGQPSPRLHALNQALLLCPGCEAVHLEVGQNLWALGMRRQALLEYRSAVTLQPTLFRQVLGELFAKGARPEELASIATFQPARMIDVARFLSAAGRVADAIVVLGQAETVRCAPRGRSSEQGRFSAPAWPTDPPQRPRCLPYARWGSRTLASRSSRRRRWSFRRARRMLPDRALGLSGCGGGSLSGRRRRPADPPRPRHAVREMGRGGSSPRGLQAGSVHAGRLGDRGARRLGPNLDQDGTIERCARRVSDCAWGPVPECRALDGARRRERVRGARRNGA